MHELDSTDWARLQALFAYLLDADDPEVWLCKYKDPRLAEHLNRLWKQHRAASKSGFLETSVASVRSLGLSEPCFSPGQVLAGRFAIERLLGAGGMGEVYLARDRRLEEPVALKTIRRRLSASPDIRRRFVAEVQSARRVTHPNVCRIFDLFDDGEIPFLVMEYLDGPTLTEWLKGGRWSPAARRKVALNLAEGLTAAHTTGIIHRDFKPDNVILTGPAHQPRAVITDFGLARPFSDREDSALHSIGGGTRDYMAPELRAGARASVASDLYAYGVVLDQLIPGNRFAQECMARNPERRPKSLDAMIVHWRLGASRRWWLTGLLAAPTVAVGAYRWMSGPRIALVSRELLLLNTFAPASDAISHTLRELLKTGLRQSPLLAVVPDERVRALGGGKWPAGQDQLLAVARRGQIPFILEGSLENVSGRLKLTVEVLESVSGKRALDASEVGDRNGLVGLADRMGLRLRRDFGESENSLRATYKSLSEVTSASPEAVEAYFQGVSLYEASNADGALTWFDRAVEIDPSFALAHLGRALALVADDRETEALQPYERALQLRSRVSERERLWIESQYANTAARDTASAVSILRRLVRLYPEEAVFDRQLALAYARLGQPQEGIDPARKAIELEPSSANNRNILICNLAQAGRAEEALDAFRQSRADGIGSHLLERGIGLAYMNTGDYEAALAAFRRMTSPPELEKDGRRYATGPMVMEGRFVEVARQFESELIATSFGGSGLARESQRVWLAYLHWLMDEPDQALLRAGETAKLDPVPMNLVVFGPAAGVAFLAKKIDILKLLQDRTSRIAGHWPSTFSNGTRALCDALLYWALADSRAGAAFAEACGLWPDPLALFWMARWQSRRKDYTGALSTLAELRAAAGTLFKYYFVGLAVLGWIEEARCLANLAHYSESLRLYKRVLDHWAQNAGDFSVMREVQNEYLVIRKKGAKFR